MWVTDRQSHREVVEETSPRSYIVSVLMKSQTNHRKTRESDLPTGGNTTPQEEESIPISTETRTTVTGSLSPSKVYATRSQSGRPPRPLNRLET